MAEKKTVSRTLFNTVIGVSVTLSIMLGFGVGATTTDIDGKTVKLKQLKKEISKLEDKKKSLQNEIEKLQGEIDKNK